MIMVARGGSPEDPLGRIAVEVVQAEPIPEAAQEYPQVNTGVTEDDEEQIGGIDKINTDAQCEYIFGVYDKDIDGTVSCCHRLVSCCQCLQCAVWVFKSVGVYFAVCTAGFLNVHEMGLLNKDTEGTDGSLSAEQFAAMAEQCSFDAATGPTLTQFTTIYLKG